ncbi:hypothetical protein RCL1_007132 [Eukaryota sp. TZLM3-RCL]
MSSRGWSELASITEKLEKKNYPVPISEVRESGMDIQDPKSADDIMTASEVQTQTSRTDLSIESSPRRINSLRGSALVSQRKKAAAAAKKKE